MEFKAGGGCLLDIKGQLPTLVLGDVVRGLNQHRDPTKDPFFLCCSGAKSETRKAHVMSH